MIILQPWYRVRLLPVGRHRSRLNTVSRVLRRETSNNGKRVTKTTATQTLNCARYSDKEICVNFPDLH